MDNPALDGLGPFVEDLYLCTARPTFHGDPSCLRRQREKASAAAGALSNAAAGNDRRKGKPAGPADDAGGERAEVLEHGARMLIR